MAGLQSPIRARLQPGRLRPVSGEGLVPVGAAQDFSTRRMNGASNSLRTASETRGSWQSRDTQALPGLKSGLAPAFSVSG